MLDVNHVTFGYKRSVNVLEDFSLSISTGSVYGLLGKNGVGKSTLLYLMTGLLRAREGNIIYRGVDVCRRLPETLADLFLLPEEITLPNVTLKQYARMYGVFYPRFSQEELMRLSDELDIDANVRLHSFSMGQRKKAYICFAIATNVSLLLMDEPTNGLDIPSKSQFRKLLASYATDERTILISTHQVRDLESLLDHLIVMDGKKLLLNESVARITERLCFDEVRPGESIEQTLVAYPSLGGSQVVSLNTSRRETAFNLECFFNALLEHREQIMNALK